MCAFGKDAGFFHLCSNSVSPVVPDRGPTGGTVWDSMSPGSKWLTTGFVLQLFFYLPLAHLVDSWDVQHPGEDEDTQRPECVDPLREEGVGVCSVLPEVQDDRFCFCGVQSDMNVHHSVLDPASGDQVPLPSLPTSSDSTYTVIKAIKRQLSACTRKIFIRNLQYSKLWRPFID